LECTDPAVIDPFFDAKRTVKYNCARVYGDNLKIYICSMDLAINSDYYLSTPNEGDISAYVKQLNDKDIHDRTLNIPYPYTEADAKWYLNHCSEITKQFGHVLDFIIRNKNGELIGGAGFHGKNIHPAVKHRDEIGYWLGKEYRNKGIMSAALPVLIKYGEEVRGIKRFEAPVFSFNTESEKVLLKCGFKEEGYFKKAYFKNGAFIDGRLFALVK
jgi:ribosomal-protein-alanine N-acetyltransferase